jgi:hypothetical protein
MTKHELAEQFEMQTLPPLPDGVHFRPVKVEALSMPHPYCITPKHRFQTTARLGCCLEPPRTTSRWSWRFQTTARLG